MRALTHRAVDGRAGLPAGTTSAYLRTRQALIEAVVERLAERDRVDLAAYDLPTGPPSAAPGPRLDGDDLDRLAAGVAEVLDSWLSTGRSRTLARYACLLEAVHRPELRGILHHGTGSRVQARDLLARAGATDPDRQGDQPNRPERRSPHAASCPDRKLTARVLETGDGTVWGVADGRRPAAARL